MSTNKVSKLKMSITENPDDLDADTLSMLKELNIDPKDVGSQEVQIRMMATAVFVLICDPDLPHAQRHDVFNAWNRFMHYRSQIDAYERFMDMPGKLKGIPEEVRLATAILIGVDIAEKNWQILHNLVTVLNPLPEDEK